MTQTMRRLCSLGAALVSTVSFTQLAQSARASTSEHCVIVLSKTVPGVGTSNVVAQQCADRADAPSLKTAAAGSTLLMTWYEDANFGGDSTEIRGNDGPCDFEGYGISDVDSWASGWSNRISSFKAWNNCSYQAAYTNTNYGGSQATWRGSWVPYVGDEMNDKIRSFRIFNG